MARTTLAAALVVVALGIGVLSAAEARFMTLDEIAAGIVGNTMTGKTHDGTEYTEFYAPDGQIRGITGDGTKYEGAWWLRREDSLMCFRYGDGPFEAGCVRLALVGDKVDFVLMDGTIEPPATLLTGNPNKL